MHRARRGRILALVLPLMALPTTATAAPQAPQASAMRAVDAAPAPAQDDDFDAFMELVLRRRVTNWEDLYRYTVRDRESFRVTGPGGARLGGYAGEYTWYVRDGFMVRSPDVIDGRRVGAAESERFEADFLERARERVEERERNRELGLEESDAEGLDREYFLDFPFEPGNYYAAGWEDFEGRRVMKVEYYPEELFEDDKTDNEDDLETSRKFDKTSRVTLWVLPDEHQIVKVAYDNIGLDFLPLQWLVQIDDVTAELVFHRPFPDDDVWLPRSIDVLGIATMANGSYTISYGLEYFDYKEAEVGARVRFRIPGIEQVRDDR